MKNKENINEDVIKKQEKEVIDLLDKYNAKLSKVKEEIEDLIKILKYEKSGKISDYLNAKKKFRKI